MDLNELKKYECPPLNIIEKFDHGDQHEQLQWSRLLNKKMNAFRVDFSDERLKKNEIVIPTFIDDLLLPLRYTVESKFGSTTYNTYANYVFYEIEYQRAHLVKISHRFCIRTFNPNDEKYLKIIILDTIDYYFQFDFKKQLWKWSQHGKNIEIWNKEKQLINQLSESDQSIEIIKRYYSIRNQFKSLHLEDFKTYDDLFDFFLDLLKCTENFIQIRKILGDLSIFTFHQIMLSLDPLKKILDSIQFQTRYEKLNFYVPTKKKVTEYQINNRISQLHISLKDIILTPGYWVFNQNIYPNLAEYYNLGQKSSVNRTIETKNELKHKLIKISDGQNKFIPLSSVEPNN